MNNDNTSNDESLSNSTIDTTNTDTVNNTRNNYLYESSMQCLNITLIEYNHVFERSSKFDNKINIMIAICGIYFTFIISFLKNLINISIPSTSKTFILFILSIILFVIIFSCYITTMIILVMCLHPVKMRRFKARKVYDKSLYNKPPWVINMLTVKDYIETIDINNSILNKSYKKLSIINILFSIVILLSFIEHMLLVFI